MDKDAVLLVEDDSIITMVLEDYLSEAGFQVTTALDGHQALLLLEQDPARFAAVLTDIRLGAGPDGWKVAARARQLSPHIPVVYMSGDSAYEWESNGAPGSVMLLKPFEPAALVTTVERMVEQIERVAS